MEPLEKYAAAILVPWLDVTKTEPLGCRVASRLFTGCVRRDSLIESHYLQPSRD